jgi:hypothetical protein
MIRELIVWHLVQRQPLSVIAAELGRSEDSVWSTIRASRRKLLRLLLQTELDAGTKKNLKNLAEQAPVTTT